MGVEGVSELSIRKEIRPHYCHTSTQSEDPKLQQKPKRKNLGTALLFSLGLCCPPVAATPAAAPDHTFVHMFMPTAVATAVVVAVR